MKKVLVVDGTSGLGKEIATIFRSQGCEVFILGRTGLNPSLSSNDFHLDVLSTNWLIEFKFLMDTFGHIDCVLYTPGVRTIGNFADITEQDISNNVELSFGVPVRLVRAMLQEQKTLAQLILISSTTGEKPKAGEVVYATGKAALTTFGHALFTEQAVQQVLVAVPGGMDTKFWKGSSNNVSEFLNPAKVAQLIITQLDTGVSGKYTIPRIGEPTFITY